MASAHNSFTIPKSRQSAKARHRNKKNYVEESAFQNVALEMRRFKLFFNEKNHEKAFRLHYYIKSRTVVKICVFGIIVLSILNFILDITVYQYAGDVFLWRSICRGVIQLPIAIAWFGLTFRKERRYRGGGLATGQQNAVDSWYEKRRCFLLSVEYWIIGSISSAVVAASFLCQTILSKEPDHGVYMLLYFVIYLFVGIPFFFSFLITWSTYIIFLISMYSLSSIDGYIQSENGQNQSFQLSAVYLFLTNVLLTIAAYSLERGERREFIHGLELNHQQTIIEGLLNNLLPVHVTDKLRNVSNNDYMIAEQVQECTILFSDMVSFTKWASTQDADVLIQRLHELYACFDDLCLLHRVYKVETIGDAYFVSSNCPIMAPDHADRCLMLGKHMMIECRKLDWAGYSPRMRIGIHTGPVMAGVVGRKMPRYHLFGATVLIAEELESSGKPDYLHISHSTKNLISSDDWELQDRGLKKVLHESKEFHTYLVDLTKYLDNKE